MGASKKAPVCCNFRTNVLYCTEMNGHERQGGKAKPAWLTGISLVNGKQGWTRSWFLVHMNLIQCVVECFHNGAALPIERRSVEMGRKIQKG